MRFYCYTTPITPVVSGRVVEAPIRVGAAVKKGDVLFKIAPSRFQAVVDQKKAALAEAEQNVKQLVAGRETAEARLQQAQADTQRAREAFERVEAIGRSGSGAVPQQGIGTKRLEFEDDISAFQLVPGTTGVVAVYTKHLRHLDVIRKVLLRMNSWTNYLFSDGH
ncbi:MAG: biotin/lipoyl-binding protein [Verrucomicrobia bacterium]|nr:biotin/lipoyl-binding protein [Verrucomicrobiota bacterium]